MKQTYRITTAVTEPFVMFNYTSRQWYGYCIDLIEEISQILNFDYNIKKSYDGNYGDTNDVGLWNGMVKELMSNQSDIGVAAMWMTRDRGTAVDFSIPFYEQNGIAIVMQKRVRKAHFLRFLHLLELEVWMSFLAAFFLTAIMCYYFERYSPFSYRNAPERYADEPDDRFFTLKECFWFTATAITPQGGGDTPKNLSGKLAAATWWLFGFVIVAAYTANLAAQETLARLEVHVESLEDLIKQSQVQYSAVEGSATQQYFYRMTKSEEVFYEMWKQLSLDESIPDHERSKFTIWDYPLEERYTKMYYNMKDNGFAENLNVALRRLRKVDSQREYALFTEAITLKYLTLTNCDLRQIGDEFAKRPFAIAIRKSLPIKKDIDDAIRQLENTGKLDALKKKWWDDNPVNAHCKPDRDVNAGFGMDLLLACFILIFIGIFISALLLAAQYYWYCYRLNARVKNIKNDTSKRED